MLPGQDHLLRTFAAVPPHARVLCVGPAADEAAALLLRLGFRTEAAESLEALPEGTFDWAAAWTDGPATGAFEALRRALVPGGWAWVAATSASPEALNFAASGAGLAVAEAPSAEAEARVVRAIYRRVGDRVTG